MSFWSGCLHSTLGCALPTISCTSLAEQFDQGRLEAFGALGSSRCCRGFPAPQSCGRWGRPCTQSREGDWWCRSPSPWGRLPISRTWSTFSHRPPWSYISDTIWQTCRLYIWLCLKLVKKWQSLLILDKTRFNILRYSLTQFVDSVDKSWALLTTVQIVGMTRFVDSSFRHDKLYWF